MMEVQQARSGEVTVCYDGKYLASRIDPRKEGRRWALKQQPHFLGMRSAIIIGAGAGFHLFELKKVCPHLRIICLEFNQEIADIHSQNLEVARFGIKILPVEFSEIFHSQDVRDAVKGSYRVVIHPSALIIDASKATDAKDALHGRTLAGLQQLAEIRNWNVKASEPKELLSIKDLEFAPQMEPSHQPVDPELIHAVVMELLV